jgi:hypothetical protein
MYTGTSPHVATSDGCDTHNVHKQGACGLPGVRCWLGCGLVRHGTGGGGMLETQGGGIE